MKTNPIINRARGPILANNLPAKKLAATNTLAEAGTTARPDKNGACTAQTT